MPRAGIVANAATLACRARSGSGYTSDPRTPRAGIVANAATWACAIAGVEGT